jgi:hypothetical protein
MLLIYVYITTSNYTSIYVYGVQNKYSHRPLLPVLIRMYLNTKMHPDTSILRQPIVIGGSRITR